MWLSLSRYVAKIFFYGSRRRRRQRRQTQTRAYFRLPRTNNHVFSHQVFANYLLQRVADKEAAFQLRLHLIYLINDVLHHCQRKNVEGEAARGSSTAFSAVDDAMLANLK